MKKEPYDIRVAHEPRSEDYPKHWAVFSKNGYVCVRSIAQTKALSKEFLCKYEGSTWADYEKQGFVLKRVHFSIKVL